MSYKILGTYFHTSSHAFIGIVAVRTNDHDESAPDEWKCYIDTYFESMPIEQVAQNIAAYGAPIVDPAIGHAYFPYLDITQYKKGA